MAAFISKQDFFGIADGVADASLKILSSDDGRTAEVAEATGEDGSIVANNVYGEKLDLPVSMLWTVTLTLMMEK